MPHRIGNIPSPPVRATQTRSSLHIGKLIAGVAKIAGAVWGVKALFDRFSAIPIPPVDPASIPQLERASLIRPDTQQYQAYTFSLSPFAKEAMNYLNGKPVCIELDAQKASELTKILEGLPKNSFLEGVRQSCREALAGQSVTLSRPQVSTAVADYWQGAPKKVPSLLGRSFEYEPRMLHAGIAYLDQGKTGYIILHPELAARHERQRQFVLLFTKKIDNEPDLQRQIESIADPDGKGISSRIGIDSKDPVEVVVKVNPDKLKRYSAAAEFLEREFNDFEAKTADQVCDLLLQTGQMLGNGPLRKNPMIVFEDTPDTRDRSMQGLIKLAKQRGTARDVTNIQNFFARKVHLDQATAEERQSFSLFAYIAPSASLIPVLMKEFAAELRDQVIQMKHFDQFDPIALAAYAHHRIGEIHPYGDGNGRLSRLVMNRILKMGGYQPVVFQTDEEYTKMVRENQKHPGAFAAYLKQKAIPWTQGQLRPNRCLQGLFCDSFI